MDESPPDPRTAPSGATTVRVRVMVEGRVQGVGYRQSCAGRAAREHVAGWVRNRRDGRVEAVFEGPADRVAAMVGWCRHGPPAARVTGVETSAEPPEALTGFRVAATA